ncbi:MAG TPA: LysR substrate-binding domain-containing protein, partial [Sphingobium sp.]
RLFRRSRMGLALTPAGAALLDRARALLDQARSIEGEMADFAGGMKGAIRLQTNPSAIIQFLPGDLASFAQRRPDVRIDLEENLSADVVALVSAGRADLGIVIGDIPTNQLATLPYRTDRLALLTPRGMFPGRAEIDFAEVQDQDFVGLVSATALTGKLISEAARADCTLRLRMQVRSFDGVCRMVEAGFGMGVLPLIAARGFAATMELDAIPLANHWAQRQMFLCLAPDIDRRGPAKQLADHLHEVGRAVAPLPAQTVAAFT